MVKEWIFCVYTANESAAGNKYVISVSIIPLSSLYYRSKNLKILILNLYEYHELLIYTMQLNGYVGLMGSGRELQHQRYFMNMFPISVNLDYWVFLCWCGDIITCIWAWIYFFYTMKIISYNGFLLGSCLHTIYNLKCKWDQLLMFLCDFGSGRYKSYSC